MSRQTKPLARTANLIVQPADQETVIYDSTTNKAYVLNPTAAAVWRAADGRRGVSDIAAHLSRENTTTEQTVWYALGQLNDLLEEPVELPQSQQSVSRRQFLQRAGLMGAAAAIPVVVSIVVPAPAHAQSASFLCCHYICGAGTPLSICFGLGSSCLTIPNCTFTETTIVPSCTVC